MNMDRFRCIRHFLANNSLDVADTSRFDNASTMESGTELQDTTAPGVAPEEAHGEPAGSESSSGDATSQPSVQAGAKSVPKPSRRQAQPSTPYFGGIPRRLLSKRTQNGPSDKQKKKLERQKKLRLDECRNFPVTK